MLFSLLLFGFICCWFLMKEHLSRNYIFETTCKTWFNCVDKAIMKRSKGTVICVVALWNIFTYILSYELSIYFVYYCNAIATLRLYNQCSFNKCYIFDKIIFFYFFSVRIDKLNEHLNTVCRIHYYHDTKPELMQVDRVDRYWKLISNVYASFNSTYSLTIHINIAKNRVKDCNLFRTS